LTPRRRGEGRYLPVAGRRCVALGELLDNLHRRQIGEAIADGYRRQPQTDEDVAIAEAAAIRSINDEPW
jgi:hypothetical protein